MMSIIDNKYLESGSTLSSDELYLPRERGLNVAGLKLDGIMNQDASLEFDDDGDLSASDMICFSALHPCLTLDKWKFLHVVDENLYAVDRLVACFHGGGE